MTRKSDEIVSFLRVLREPLALSGTNAAQVAWLAAKILRETARSLLVVSPTDRDAENFAEVASFFLGRPKGRETAPLARRVLHLPSRAGMKRAALGKPEATAGRIEALYALRAAPDAVIVSASALALLERLMPPAVLSAHAEYLVVGESLDAEALFRRLLARGYSRVNLVEEYGDAARRGGVVDVFSPLYRHPVRLEFFGDELESARLFHPGTQRSLGVLEDAVILPAGEVILDEAALRRAEAAVYEDVAAGRLSPPSGNAQLERLREGRDGAAFEGVLPVFYEHTASLFDYLPEGALVVFAEGARREMESRAASLARDWEEGRPPDEWRRPASQVFFAPAEVMAEAERFQRLFADPVVRPEGVSRVVALGVRGHEDLAAAVAAHEHREHLLHPLAARLREWEGEGVRALLVCSREERARRLVELLSGYGVTATFRGGDEGFLGGGGVTLTAGPVAKGFFWAEEALAVVTEEEIFGKRPARRRTEKSLAGVFLDSFRDLHAGDLVVHLDHGIGVYKGLVHLAVGATESDFLHLEYQDGDRLYVPVDRLEKVQKYLGVENEAARVDRLGGKQWETAKQKARAAARMVAEELLRLYAMRRVREGFRFSPPDRLYREFETAFAFEETPDQEKAIEDVLRDMTSPKPMDRLICGDVGYGKTEVALRAAFKAVLDGKQVAMLVPTTVLAEQHHQTLKERFAPFPVTVESLSRFKTAAQQKKVLEGLKNGAVDVVVGTHRLLSKDVTFRELGLVIIDEEHRFGVKDKERLKALRVSVDVLTLTATPIPRTLHMSLSGIRDLSTIETAPQDRRAIETFVSCFDEFTIREAVGNELARGGQVFFVHNHVQTIWNMAALVRRLTPEARVAVAHGQMGERELEKVMLDFVHRKVDVLVCTTIIESGLDIPAANTIIINRADTFGLAQIYQLRGRVGRSSEQAFAYLLIPGEHLVTPDAQKRLRALMDFSELGAGFKIALNDLQIRGGGTILGAEQSGHIAAVGYELYLELLEETIRAMKGEPEEEPGVDPEMKLALSAFLPGDFIPDADQRLLGYKRLATAREDDVIDEIVSEWRDRYGAFPDAVKNLLLLARVRLLLKRLMVSRLEADDRAFTLTLADVRLEAAFRGLDHVFPQGGRVVVQTAGSTLGKRLARLKSVLQQVAQRATDIKSNR